MLPVRKAPATGASTRTWLAATEESASGDVSGCTHGELGEKGHHRGHVERGGFEQCSAQGLIQPFHFTVDFEASAVKECLALPRHATSDERVERPFALRNVKTMPPPMTILSTFSISDSITPIFDDTLRSRARGASSEGWVGRW